MFRIYIILALSLCLNLKLIGQGKPDEISKAYELAQKAVPLMENGDYQSALRLLIKANHLDPENYIYPYEIGYVHYLRRDYKTAIRWYERVIQYDNITDQCYQMLGNLYYLDGNAEQALISYKQGLELFPNSGRLYTELGNKHQHDWFKALSYYEKGIEKDPDYPSNYYWSSKIYCASDQEIWGLLYGELFINLERTSERTAEIKQLLFSTYQNEIKLVSDTQLIAEICNTGDIEQALDDGVLLSPPYASHIFQHTLNQSLIGISNPNIEGLNRMRHNFVEHYYEQGFHQKYPNSIVSWHHELIELGYLDLYNYWLFKEGAEEEFALWYQFNEDKFDRFIQWFTDNPLDIVSHGVFHRGQF